jgi:Holliday junction resolvase RusA-like endonuclease
MYPITPIAKPRMTHRDKYRPIHKAYFKFAEDIATLGIKLPNSGAHITFGLPMPRSWSKRKKAAHVHQGHQQTPDLSNLLKALEDACYVDDKVIWNYGSLTKLWAQEGYIEIKVEDTNERVSRAPTKDDI